MIVSIGSDHAGFKAKESVKRYLESENIRYSDEGTNSEESVDYPIFAAKVAGKIAMGECDLGIIICGTGIGVSIVANKIKSIRAARCANSCEASMARKHNNANVLCLGARTTSEDEILETVKTFLNTEFEGGRHQKRVDQISKIENQQQDASQAMKRVDFGEV